jgi:hypothetical protein
MPAISTPTNETQSHVDVPAPEGMQDLSRLPDVAAMERGGPPCDARGERNPTYPVQPQEREPAVKAHFSRMSAMEMAH